MINVANNNDVSVVGYVPASIPLARIVYRHALQIAHPADDRNAIRVCLQCCCIQLFVEHRLRLIFGPQPAFFHDNLDFLGKLLGVKRQMAHAIGLEADHLRQFFFRHLLKIRRVILAGKGVVAAAGGSHQPAEFAGADAWCAFEHHVLEQVRNAGGAVAFIHAASAVPDHMYDSWRPTVFLDDDAQTVVELLFKGVGENGSRCAKADEQGAEAGDSS